MRRPIGGACSLDSALITMVPAPPRSEFLAAAASSSASLEIVSSTGRQEEVVWARPRQGNHARPGVSRIWAQVGSRSTFHSADAREASAATCEGGCGEGGHEMHVVAAFHEPSRAA